MDVGGCVRACVCGKCVYICVCVHVDVYGLSDYHMSVLCFSGLCASLEDQSVKCINNLTGNACSYSNQSDHFITSMENSGQPISRSYCKERLTELLCYPPYNDDNSINPICEQSYSGKNLAIFNFWRGKHWQMLKLAGGKLW